MTNHDHGVVAGNVYDKYGTKNPIARVMMGGFLSTVGTMFAREAPESVLEVGCGEGELLSRLLSRSRARVAVATDLSSAMVGDAARRHAGSAHFAAADACHLPFADDSFDLVLACEVLEHLEEPATCVREVARVSRRGAIFTVPREPLWRALNLARGKYVRDWGNTPGHVQHFSARRFRELIGDVFEIVDCRRPLPWTAIRARVRG